MLSYVDDEGRLVETGPAQDRTERNGSEQSLKTRR